MIGISAPVTAEFVASHSTGQVISSLSSPVASDVVATLHKSSTSYCCKLTREVSYESVTVHAMSP